MKTTPGERQGLQTICDTNCWPNLFDVADVCRRLLDDFTAIEAELAALRRVEAEDLYLRRSHDTKDPTTLALRWCVVGPLSEGKRQGLGATLSAALADYDAKKEQR